VKRKFEGGSSGKKFGKNYRGNKRFDRSGTKTRKVETKEDNQDPWCLKCRIKGHLARECTMPNTCFSCGQEGHIKANCSKTTKTATYKNDKGKGTGTARGNTRVFVMTAEDARRVEDVITGRFLVNNAYAHILFDSGANKSFVSLSFMPHLEGKAVKLETPYIIEVANGHEVRVGNVLKD
jgi:6-phosphogluconolactonase/glucosamine-6-phosphate isomerase/deaminase